MCVEHLHMRLIRVKNHLIPEQDTWRRYLGVCLWSVSAVGKILTPEWCNNYEMTCRKSYLLF